LLTAYDAVSRPRDPIFRTPSVRLHRRSPGVIRYMKVRQNLSSF